MMNFQADYSSVWLNSMLNRQRRLARRKERLEKALRKLEQRTKFMEIREINTMFREETHPSNRNSHDGASDFYKYPPLHL